MTGILLVKPFVNAATDPDTGDVVPGAVEIQDWTLDRTVSIFIKYAATGYVYWDGGLLEPWLSPQQGMDQYEIHVSKTAESNIAGGDALDTWLSLGTDRKWTVATPSGARFIDLTVQIRRVSDGAIMDTAHVVLTADADVSSDTGSGSYSGGGSGGIGGIGGHTSLE